MKTFEEKYCEAHRCTAQEFRRSVFWKCLHRHAVPVAPFILLFNPSYFDLDRILISESGRAVKTSQVWEEVREYFINPKHAGWVRRRANIRVSARRLLELARSYLPISGEPPPTPYSSSGD